MRNVMRVIAIGAAFALTVWVGMVAFAQSSSSPTPSVATSTPSASTSSATPAGDGDQFKGPCDEAEHIGDPECEGVIPRARGWPRR